MTDSAPTNDLQAAFDAAIAHSKTLATRPDNLTLLQLYALYKQGSSGDVAGERPGMTDFVARAKWDAWAALRGASRAQAMQDYIERVRGL
ncbi:acyl-CoA-binding protein [Thiomonas intermedia]|uniref:acyl-CoA-binding protein n=1 Tax=Thiomonas intermedia TaxID=926 RepID=UPI0009A4AB5B|nr:acyl-CoA-binding protein [Thiomonas intermedia]